MNPDNTTFLTPNRRLAVHHTKQHQLRQISQGLFCWQSIDILPFTSWIERTWHDYSLKEITDSFLLLSPSQELTLWENIISESAESEHLLQISGTAEIAKSAWALLKQWQIDLNNSALKATEDSFTFLKWATQFQKHNVKHKLLDQNSISDLLTEKIKSGLIISPKKIVLISFTEISPQQQALLSACEAQGSSVEHFHQEKIPNSVARISLADAETELLTMARWAKTILEKNDRPLSIGCIIPNLEDIRDSVNRIFTDVFTETGYYTTDSLTLPFNISAGKSLARYPVIHTALQLLELHKNTISIDVLSSLLRSPFIGDAEKEMLKRADFDNQLRRDNVSTITLTDILKTKNKPELFANRIKKYLTAKDKIRPRHSTSEWVKIFMDLLTEFGWPGERSVNSEEYQIIQRWVDLLGEYNRFDKIIETCNFQTALHHLIRLTANTVFQPQSPETPVQILGILEAAEMPFDYLWIMGMDDTRWPPPPKPNPFIPQHLQRSLHMPHANAERELQFCKNIIEQLKNSANEIIFSHALFDNESEVRVSALIEDVSDIRLEELHLPDYTKASEIIFKSQQLESIIDDKATPVDVTETVRGGAKIFELQAACPFKAFAELRLFAKPIETTSPGLRALDRGNIMHKALEIIWRELKDSATLHAKTSEELEALILTSIEEAIFSVTEENCNDTKYLKLETQRLQKIISNWLIIEKQRPPFTVVALEQRNEITFANIPITLQIDRIDELANHEKFIIDYKTGKNNQPQDWFGARPDAPQLPLYCLVDSNQATGIAYAVIHPETMKLTGISAHDLEMKGVDMLGDIRYATANNWNDQLHLWHETLEKLGRNHCQGHAEIDPKDPQETCEHCKLKSFCRIYEKNYE